MNAPLTVDDPLAGQEVTVVVTLPAGDGPRDERPILVSLGIAGQPPIIKTGTFGDAPALINEAWTAFGVRAQVAGAAPAEPETETANEELGPRPPSLKRRRRCRKSRRPETYPCFRSTIDDYPDEHPRQTRLQVWPAGVS